MNRFSHATFVIKVIGALAILVVAVTCVTRAAEPDKGTERPWGKPVEGQSISISSAKATYRPGEPIVLEVRFKNVGKADVRAVEGSPIDTYYVAAMLPDGKLAPLTLYGKGGADREASRAILTLKPRQETSVQLDLSQHFDLTLDGKYTFSLERRVWKDSAFSSTLKAKSNELEITVDESLPSNTGAETKPAERMWGSTVEGQTISITREKATYYAEPVTICVCFKNVGRENVKAARKAPLGTYLLTVLASDGKPAPYTLYGKEAIKPDGTKNIEKLAPGEETCDELVLNSLFDFTVPGVYAVSVQRPVWKDGGVSSTLKATLNKLQITVR